MLHSSALELCSRRCATQIHVYLIFTLPCDQSQKMNHSVGSCPLTTLMTNSHLAMRCAHESNYHMTDILLIHKKTENLHYKLTRSSATAKSTTRPSCLVGELHDIYRVTNNRSTANQPLVRNWPWMMKPTEFRQITQNNGHYNVQGHSRSPILVPIESPYATSY